MTSEEAPGISRRKISCSSGVQKTFSSTACASSVSKARSVRHSRR
jgi:hypothetical protein